MNLIVLGAPGAGKGTQANFLAERFHIEHISTGDMFRDEISRQSEVGKKMKEYMQKGQLVPDEIVIGLLSVRIGNAKNANGYILDGFPRNLHQALKLQDMTGTPDAAIEIVVDDQAIVERISGRRVCPACGKTFHMIHHKPAKENMCDFCGTALVQRDDDKAATVLHRLEVYHEMTEPIVDFYKQENLLVTVSGVGDVQEITESIIAALKEKL